MRRPFVLGACLVLRRRRKGRSLDSLRGYRGAHPQRNRTSLPEGALEQKLRWDGRCA